jgi:hypothetical protein
MGGGGTDQKEREKGRGGEGEKGRPAGDDVERIFLSPLFSFFP